MFENVDIHTHNTHTHDRGLPILYAHYSGELKTVVVVAVVVFYFINVSHVIMYNIQSI